jgi:hypothetical protein
MAIDLLSLEPTRISRNLKGKYMLMYGEPKVGKTTLLSKLPKSLILAFEPGTNALNNAYVQPILRWADFKMVLKQLKLPALQEKFEFIGIDTADIAYEFCEKFICTQNSVDNISEIPYGKGYSLCKKEFSDSLRELAQLGYGICFISHATEKTFKNEKGEDYIRIVPAMPSRPYDIINKMVDIIGYIRDVREPETGMYKKYLFLRGDDRFLAGSRFKYIEPKINFGYESLANAIYDAIDKQAAEDGTELTQEKNVFYDTNTNKKSFDEVMAVARQLWMQLTTGNETAANHILDFTEKIFGKRMKLSEATPAQQELLELVVEEMRSM